VTMSSSRQPLDDLLDALRSTLGGLTPEPLLSRMRPVLEGFFEQFQLVQKRDFETHLASVARLERQVADLERRILELEAAARRPPQGTRAQAGVERNDES